MTRDAQDLSPSPLSARVEALDGARAQLALTVAALQRPASYPGAVRQVETIETHMSFVFLTEQHAFKLKKPIRTPLLDHTTIEKRRRACENELELNRRLAPDVYIAAVPVVLAGGNIRVDQPGSVIDWVVKMRRLPRDHMLDVRIERQTVRDSDIDGLAAVLADFYAQTERVPLSAEAYRNGIAADIAAKRDSLSQEHYGIDEASVTAAVAGQKRWLARCGELLDTRATSVVDAHGDLRPEHICLEEAGPVVIDCLEFSEALRRLDPVSELSFLALECRRLGAAWIGDRLLVEYAEASGDRAPGVLVPFYQSYHALVRATVAVWHLDDDALDHSDRWRRRARWYLQIARQLL